MQEWVNKSVYLPSQGEKSTSTTKRSIINGELRVDWGKKTSGDEERRWLKTQLSLNWINGWEVTMLREKVEHWLPRCPKAFRKASCNWSWCLLAAEGGRVMKSSTFVPFCSISLQIAKQRGRQRFFCVFPLPSATIFGKKLAGTSRSLVPQTGTSSVGHCFWSNILCL